MPYPEQIDNLSNVNPEHIGLLTDTLRAPSAHNAQPWQILPETDGRTYQLHYNQHAGLPHDLDNKDAYLTMGAFVETMVLQAPNHGFQVDVTPELTREGRDLFIARAAVAPLEPGQPVDPLSAWIDKRAMNRNKYTDEPLTDELEGKLKDLGNAVVDTALLKDTVLEASVISWKDKQFVHDLQMWLRKDNAAPDGLTAGAMNLSGPELLALDVVFRRQQVKSTIMARIFSSSEVAMFASAPKAAVLSSPDMTPPSLFKAGRRLLRSWVTIAEAGYTCQPYSVAVDQPVTIPKVAEIAGVEHPVSLYRVGMAAKPPKVVSNRKPLSEVVTE